MAMTNENAIETLRAGGSMAELAEAIAAVASNPRSSIEDIMLGLAHGGFIQEQAALALYRRTGEPIPKDRSKMRLSIADWSQHHTSGAAAAPSVSSPDEQDHGHYDSLVEHVIQGLPEAESRIIILHYVEGITIAEIGQLLNLSPPHVRRLLSQALARLRSRLATRVGPLSRLFDDLAKSA